MNILVIGTSVIDLFLKVDPHHADISENLIKFTLGDKVPIHTQKLAVGGNAANVAVGLTRLEIPSTLYTYLGDDILSQEIRNNITQEGVELVANVGEKETTPIHLIFNFESDRIIFSDYTVKQYTFDFKGSINPEYAYLTSIGNKWQNAYSQILDFLKKNNIPFAFSPGSRQLEDIGEIFLEALKSASSLFVNKEEAIRILNETGKEIGEVQDMLLNLQAFGPKIVSITDGKNGAYCIDDQQSTYYIKAVRDDVPIIQKAGAGDAYASGFLASYLLKNPINECMRWGSFNAHAVMEHLGAQEGLLTKSQLSKLSQKHADFKAEKMG